MFRLALFVMIFGTVIGAMMPSSQRSASSASASGASNDGFFIGPEFKRGGAARPAAFNSGNSGNSGGSGVSLERSDDGHFYADVAVNGTPIRFLVDTGASGIALAREDAERAAVPLSPGESGTVVGRGASGDVTGQYVTLDRVALGGTEVRDARAVMLDGGDQSLLGQSFLSKFDSVEIRGDTMVLR